MKIGSVVQLDRMSDFGSDGWGFESSLGDIIFFLFISICSVFSQSSTIKIKLPKSLNETSGLEYYKSFLVTNNDSGDDAILYYFDLHGQIAFERKFNNLKNYDWEDLCADKNFLYIADIGNNFDTRKNLRVIKVSKNPKKNNYEIINFLYPEQKEFTFNRASEYDAEGLISFDNYLLIFTKNRKKNITEIYRIPKKKGNHKAKKILSLKTKSIITGADYNERLKLLVLTGTKDFNDNYILKIKNFNLSKNFNSEIETHKLSIGKAQVEAIKIIDENNFWITSEDEKNNKPLLYRISL